MTLLGSHTGAWTGTKGFRLMPSDALEFRPAEATVSLAAGGHLTSLAYRWEHPTDGPHDGLVVLWSDTEPGKVRGFWGDSWGQQPQPMPMAGRASGTTVELAGEYGDGWGWLISLDIADELRLRLTMSNVVPPEHAGPEGPAGPYVSAVADLGRA